MTSRRLKYTLSSMLLGTLLRLPGVAEAASTESSPAYSAPIGADLADFSSALPILVVDTLGSGPLTKDGVDHPSTLRVFAPSLDNGSSFGRGAQIASAMTLSVRGSSSAEFPKQSFTIALRDAKGKKRAQPLLDLPAAETWVLAAPWRYDPGYLNNALVYRLSDRLGRWAARTRFVEVFLNRSGEVDRADYAGVYVLTDRLDPGENRVVLAEARKGAPARDAGYLFKIDAADADEFSWNTARGIGAGDSALVLVSPKAGDATAAQHAYIVDYVQQMENALHADRAAGWSRRTHLDYLDRDSWIDHHILNTLAANPDALIRSAYFTKNAAGKVTAGPVWDFDRALGSHADQRSLRWDVWSGVGGADVWHTGWWGVIASDPEFMQGWIDRWQSVRRAEFSNEALSHLIAQLGGAVTAAASARDAARWPDNRSPLGDHAAQLQHTKGWTVLRAQWIDEQFVAAPSVAVVGEHMVFTPPPGAVLVYTLDGSDPRSLGGAVAPNAETTSAPLLVAATANAHVRSYRSDGHVSFPGSPWSSAAGTLSASPLAPRGRLVNLSSRGRAGLADEALIVGIGLKDTTSKQYLARAIGPGLAVFGVTGFIPDPQLAISSGGQELVRNRGWDTGDDATALISYAKAVGAFPLAPGSTDCALSREVAAATCTFQITSDQGGVGLAEVYELDEKGRIGNLSARAMVRGREDALVAGFVIRGPAHQRLLVRAVGPTLRGLGISHALSEPILEIHSGTRSVASSHRPPTEREITAITKAATAVGAFKLDPDSADAALLLTLPPGAYTAEISGRPENAGIALLEIYDVP